MTTERRTVEDRRRILFFRAPTPPSRKLILLTGLAALVYFGAMAFVLERGNPTLFWLLIAGEVFHVWLALSYLHTVWRTDVRAGFHHDFQPPVDVFITVAGEPADIVERTVRAARRMDYPEFKVHILNDGFVAQKDNWQEIELLAKRLRVHCITRTVPGGAKAGNINNALRLTSNPYFAVFDADHVPHRDFLTRTMGYFGDRKMGFVQTPQFYRNRDENYVAAGAWEQQEIFFGAICMGKNRTNSMFMCGTNMVIRREAILAAGGMSEDNIAEDFLTSLFIHAKGWKSTYVSRILAEGLAPEDFSSYLKQQFRWARGSLEVLFRHNPFFKRGLSFGQRIQYLASASYHLNGPVVLVDALFPVIYFFTGEVPFKISTMSLAAVFLPYIFLMIYVLQRSTNFAYTYRALGFSMSSFWTQIRALVAYVTGQKSGFAVTSKRKVSGNFLGLIVPHLLYFALCAAGFGVALARDGMSASLLNNSAWAIFNMAVFAPALLAVLPSVFESASRSAPLATPELRRVTLTAHARETEPSAGKKEFISHEHKDDI